MKTRNTPAADKRHEKRISPQAKSRLSRYVMRPNLPDSLFICASPEMAEAEVIDGKARRPTPAELEAFGLCDLTLLRDAAGDMAKARTLTARVRNLFEAAWSTAPRNEIAALEPRLESALAALAALANETEAIVQREIADRQALRG